MTLTICRRLGSLLLTAGLLLTPLLAGAAIVTTDQLASSSSTDAERQKVEAFIDRANAAGQLRARGVDASDVKARIAALSGAEVHTLAGKIDSLPAGGNFGGFTDQQVIIVLLVVILVVLVV